MTATKTNFPAIFRCCMSFMLYVFQSGSCQEINAFSLISITLLASDKQQKI